MSTRPPLLALLEPIETIEPKSGIEGIDCIYVINLKERMYKWEAVKEAFAKHSLTPSRVEAINGWHIPLDRRKEMIRFPLREIRGGEVGCFLSHLSVYQDAVRRKSGAVWICEDDMEFDRSPEEIPSLLKELTSIDPNWDILYTDHSIFGSLPSGKNPYGHSFQRIEEDVGDNLMRMHGRWGNHSIIFSTKGVRKVFNHYYFNPIMWAPLDIDLHYVPSIREYSVKQSITKVTTKVSDTGPSSEFCR